MFSTHTRWFMAIVAVAVMVLSGCASQKQVNSGLQAGAGVVDITPDDKNALDPLLAKALVFRQKNELAAIVVCDVIGISGKTMSRNPS